MSVLMLGTLLISCATAFTWFVRMQVRSVMRERVALTNRTMAVVLSEAVFSAVSKITDKTKADSPRQDWFKPFLFPADNLGIWAVMISPLDDKLPLNALFLPDRNTVRHELRGPWEDMWDKLGRRELAVPVLDFMDRNDKGRVGGVERDEFLNRIPLDLSELLLMNEITPELLYGGGGGRCVADYCTLWSGGKLNVNVAPPEVLALLPGISDAQAQSVAGYCRENVIASIADFQSIPGMTPRSATALINLIAFKSRFFRLRVEFLDESPGGTAYNIIFDRTAKKAVRWEES